MRRALLPLLLLLGVWTYGYRLGSPALLDDPNDAQYAEVAREMMETGEWITPQLDYVVFLNKPPLSYWLIAASYELFGVNEFAARLPGALTALVLLLLAARLGRALWDESAGPWAAAITLAMGGVLIEARHVRPDLLLATAIAGTLLACTRLARNPDDRWAAVGLQIALAAGVLAKGIVALLLPGSAVMLAMICSGNWRLLRTLARPGAWWLFVLLVVPWHTVVALRHPGFTWDYIVNEHLLFFLDRKVPRDSDGIALWRFWGIFAFRLFPWTLFLPLAVLRGWPRGDERTRWAGGLLLGLMGTVLLLFSLSPSRLEHYSIPALPAAALLIASLFHTANERRSPLLAAHVLVLAGMGMAAPFVIPHELATADWLASATELPHLSRTASWIFAAAGLAMTALMVRPRLAPLALIAMMVALVPMVQRGLTLIAPFDSSAPLARVITAFASESDTVVYEAPIEYQSVAGLLFYTQRKWLLLRPQGFESPTYLAPHEDELFISRDELERRWARGRVFLVSDPLIEGRTTMKGLVPEPVYNVAHSGNRWIVGSDRP